MKLLLSFFVLSSLLLADFDASHWQYRWSIAVPPGDSLAEFPIEANIYTHSLARLHDLRIVRDGAEIAYQLTVSAPSHEVQYLPLT